MFLRACVCSCLRACVRACMPVRACERHCVCAQARLAAATDVARLKFERQQNEAAYTHKTCTHAYTHTYTHTRTRTRTHARARPCTHAQRTHAHGRVRAHARTHNHRRVRACALTRRPTRVRACELGLNCLTRARASVLSCRRCSRRCRRAASGPRRTSQRRTRHCGACAGVRAHMGVCLCACVRARDCVCAP